MILFLMGFLAGGIAGFFLAALMAAAAREAPKPWPFTSGAEIEDLWAEFDRLDDER